MKRMLLAGAVLLLSVSAHAADGLPQAMAGDWCAKDGVFVRGHCPEHTDGELTIQHNSYHGHEEDCTISNARPIARDSYLVIAQCSGEGEIWLAAKVFRLAGKELHVEPIGDDNQDNL